MGESNLESQVSWQDIPAQASLQLLTDETSGLAAGITHSGRGPAIVGCGEPDAAMVGMVLFLASNIGFHRPIADDIGTGGGLDGIEVGKTVVGSEGSDEVFSVMEFNGLIFFGEDELGLEGCR